MEFIHTVAVFLFVLLILVSIHEWGHFIVARKCGVKVLRFSVGFGKPFWRFYDKYGTEFAVAPIPLGGYVKMLDETDENVSPADKNKTFESRKTWQQIAILAAGPIANFILAVLLFWWLAAQETTLPSPVIGEVEPNTPAAYAGLEEGQTLYDPESTTIVHHINQGLRAHKLFQRDKDYIVRDGNVVLIDEFTGRMMHGRRLSDGLHQAIEAKDSFASP